jgi:tetratricopeptide (TPR) repeat protein
MKFRILLIAILLAASASAQLQTQQVQPPPKRMEISVLRARLFGINAMISAGRLQEAQQSIDLLRAEAGEDPLIDGIDAFLAFHRHEFSASRDILAKAVKTPDAPIWWKVLLTLDMFAMGDSEQAKELLLKVQSEDPKGASEAMASMGAAAAQDFNQRPSVEVMLALGFLYRTIGARRLELTGLNGALRKFPKDPRLLVERLNLLADASDPKTIVEEAAKAIVDAPENDAVLGAAGSLFAKFGIFDKAVEALQKAEQLNPQNYRARLDLGAALQGQKKLPEAQAELSALVGVTPPPPTDILVTAYATLGSVLTELKRWPEALAMMQQGVDLKVESAQLLNNLAWLYAVSEDTGIRDPKKAVELATKAVTITRQRNPSIIDTLAEAYFASGDKEKAVEYERKALSIAPNNEELKQHLARYQGLPAPPPAPPPTATPKPNP